ncbi:hypothetical protein DFH29DRAFT_1074463 [Suillus ampliporus]|nr:hypothetical protein DFH29DRAFT_1074463 [Suillus ampliporus]
MTPYHHPKSPYHQLPPTTQSSWYTRRASVSAIYLAAELHQLTSPRTASTFLDSLLENAEHAEKALDETTLFASYVWKSWRGIVKSSGIVGKHIAQVPATYPGSIKKTAMPSTAWFDPSCTTLTIFFRILDAESKELRMRRTIGCYGGESRRSSRIIETPDFFDSCITPRPVSDMNYMISLMRTP